MTLRPVGRKTRRANDLVSLAGHFAPVLSGAVGMVSPLALIVDDPEMVAGSEVISPGFASTAVPWCAYDDDMGRPNG
jgi:hypothetical protein